ncbi:MAG: four helix bundle protein [Caldilineaceae bacterium]
MTYEEWLATVPEAFKGDALWRIEAYRLGLFAGDLGWPDVTKLMRDRRTLDVSDQLYRALGSISANIAEGFSRDSHKEKARFYEYALGSARESRDWYYKARHILGPEVTQHRIELLTQIIRLLLKMIPNQRQQALKEDEIEYQASTSWYADAPLPMSDK